MDDAPPSLSISATDIRKWLESHAENAGMIADLVEANRVIEQRLEAAKVLAPQLFGEQQMVAGGDAIQTWPELITFALKGENGGRTQAHILNVGRKTSMAERVEKSPGGLYNAVARMVGKKLIVREDDLLYLPETWAAIQSGEKEDDGGEVSTGASTIGDEVVELLRDGKPRVPKDIFDALPDEEMREKLSNNPNYGYTVLGRLLKRGLLKRADGFYSIAKKEAPSSAAASAATIEEGATSSNDTSPLFRVIK